MDDEVDPYFREQHEIESQLAVAAEALADSGVHMAESMHLNCMRADGSGSVRRLHLNPEPVKRYLNRISDIAKRSRATNWSQAGYKRPEIFADLRFLRIDGDLNVSVDVPVLLDYTEVVGKMRVTVTTLCERFDASHSHLDELVVELEMDAHGQATRFNLNLVESESKSIDVDAGKGNLRGAYLNLTKAKIGVLDICDLRIRNIRADGCTFSEAMSMHRCRISVARFAQCSFSDGWRFWSCSFFNAPNFTDAKMDRQYTEFFDCRFISAGKLFGSDCSIDDVAKYRYLRGHFARSKDTQHENLFYCLEQRGLRIAGGSPKFDRLLSFLYDALGDYGNSVGRPLGIFAGQIVVFAAIFWLTGGAIGKGVFQQHPAIGLSLQNSFNPIGLFSEKSIISIESVEVYGLALLQAILSIVLIALMLIGIRSRFKKGGGGESS